jgi:ferritin-like metal-binding protein YciE
MLKASCSRLFQIQQTLEEEGEADRKLTAVAENEVNVRATATSP